MTSRRLAWLFGAVLLAACGGSEPVPSPHIERGAQRPSGAGPGWELRIGLIPEFNVFRQLERFEPLAHYLSSTTGARVRLQVLARYGNAVEQFSAEKLDGAFFGSFAYVLAHARHGVEPVARPVDGNGRSTYFGVILVRRDGGIRDGSGLAGKRFAFVDRATTAGYLLPRHYFKSQGITDYRAFLGEYYFAGTHEDAVWDVLEGRADAAAAKSTVIQRLGYEDPRIIHELDALARSPDVPENALCLAPWVDPALRRRVRDALLGMESDPRGREVLQRLGALRFVPTVDADYAAVYRYAEELGIDVATFDTSSGLGGR